MKVVAGPEESVGIVCFAVEHTISGRVGRDVRDIVQIYVRLNARSQLGVDFFRFDPIKDLPSCERFLAQIVVMQESQGDPSFIRHPDLPSHFGFCTHFELLSIYNMFTW